jgi:DNA-binding transcriptional regulator YdaS (Cro superfamily)
MNPTIQKACELVGGQTSLAKLLTEITGKNVTQQRVRNWAVRGDDVPTHFVAAIEKATCGRVTRKDICPNDWPSIWPELAEATLISLDQEDDERRRHERREQERRQAERREGERRNGDPRPQDHQPVEQEHE